MTPRQWNTVEDLTVNDNHIVVECDENLAGDILDCPVYNTKGVSEHLGDTNVLIPTAI
jgi:hypothetical protein